AALHGHLRDERRMQREDSLDAFVVHDAANGERLVDPAALAHDDGAAEDLDAFLVAFDDSRRDVNGITDAKLRDVLLQVRLLDGFDDTVGHGWLRFPISHLRLPFEARQSLPSFNGQLAIGNGQSLLVSFLVRLPQIGPALFRSYLPLFVPPRGN